MTEYSRTSLEDFRSPVSEEDVRAVFAAARAEKTFGDQTPWASYMAYRFQEHLAVPRSVILSVWPEGLGEPDHSTIAHAISTWLRTAHLHNVYAEICDAMLARTETVFDDARGEKSYASAIAGIFDVPSEVGRRTFHTDAQSGKRWGRLVAEATTAAVLQHLSEAQPAI